mgnify:FL=1
MNFCTLFDSYYLHKGIALYLSLERVTSDFHLYVMAFDRNSYDMLTKSGFSHMTVELLDDFETPELKAVKPTRNKAEYCWTAGPSVIYHFLTKYGMDKITYLDSDLFFLSSPEIIEQEACESSVVITEQGIGEEAAQRYGRYCVQYMTFRNDEDGLGALTWWRDKCIEWCFQIMEPTRYADQKYLDEFPIRWKSVFVLKNLGAGIAPWNMLKYQYTEHSLKYKGEEWPFVFFHMHGVIITVKDGILTAHSQHYALNKDVTRLFFEPYAALMAEVSNKYLGQTVVSYRVKDMNPLKKIEYKVRAWVKNNQWLTNFYFKHFKKKEVGHGTLIGESK